MRKTRGGLARFTPRSSVSEGIDRRSESSVLEINPASRSRLTSQALMCKGRALCGHFRSELAVFDGVVEGLRLHPAQDLTYAGPVCECAKVLGPSLIVTDAKCSILGVAYLLVRLPCGVTQENAELYSLCVSSEQQEKC
jgi:hypothetical protein